MHGMAEQDAVGLTQDSAPLEVGEHGRDAVFRTPIKRSIFLRIVTFGLQAPASRRDIMRRLQMRRAEAREEDVTIIEIRPMCINEIRSIDTQTHDHSFATGQPFSRIKDVSGCPDDHRYQFW